MHGFKYLLPHNLFTDQAFNPLSRKNDQYKKILQQSTDTLTSIWKIFSNQSINSKKIIKQVQKGLEAADHIHLQPYFISLLGVYQDHCQLSEQFSNNIEQYLSELTSSNSSNLNTSSSLLTSFQNKLRTYQNLQNGAIQASKKHSKQIKNLSHNIDAYKQSFNEVRLIYNVRQKIKRYSNCEQAYQSCRQEADNITEIADKLSSTKISVIDNFIQLEEKIEENYKTVNIKNYKFLAYFTRGYSDIVTEKLEILSKHKQELEKSKMQPFLEMKILAKQHNVQNKSQQQKFCTLRQALNLFSNQPAQDHQLKLSSFLRHFQEAIQKQKNKHKLFVQMHYEFYRFFDKCFVSILRETTVGLQKNKKKMKEIYLQIPYQQFKKTLKLLSEIISISEKYLKKIWKTMEKINEMEEEKSNTFKLLLSECKNNCQKILNDEANVKGKQNQLIKKYQFLSHLILGFDQKINNINQKIKRLYNDVIGNLYVCISQISSVCTEMRPKDYEEAKRILEIKRQHFDKLKGITFEELKKEETKKPIVFNFQNEKIYEFTKLKKPADIEIDDSAKNNRVSCPTENLSQSLNLQHNDSLLQSPFTDKANGEQYSPTKQKNKVKKYVEFLTQKITFVEEEEYLKVFSCALADKIILQGKLFITTHRLCFYSKFNAGNLFFGGTFIQIPKKDIITFEKRKNGIIFNNSISLTTINGQLLFTSFLKRNEAFDLISQITGKLLDDQAYKSDSDDPNESQSQQISINQNPNEEEHDDFKEQQSISRYQQIEKNHLYKHPYKQCTSVELMFDSLSAYKAMKYFLTQQQVIVNRKKYENFTSYYKKIILQHKDLEQTPFEPPLSQFLNKSTFKNTCPIVFTKSSKSIFPVMTSGIPFMPKTAITSQVYKLYLVSKHKWISQTIVTNSGAPYTDCFNLYIRTVCESNNEGQCKIKASIYLNFIKNTMMRGVIESKSFQQSASQLNKLYSQYKKYLQGLDNQKKNKNKKISAFNAKLQEQGHSDEKQINSGEIQTLKEEVQSLKISNQLLKKKINSNNLFYRIIIFGIILISVLIIVS